MGGEELTTHNAGGILAMKKRSYRAQKVNEVRWEEVADRVKEKAVGCWQHLPSHILRVLASLL